MAFNDASDPLITRKAIPGDAPALTALWQEVFGDPEEYIEGFLRLLPGAGFGVVAEYGGEMAAMAYVLTGLGIEGKKCGYIYAVGTLPKFRGRGCGAAVTKAARDYALESGCEIIATQPSEPSLYGWYEELIEVTPAAFASPCVIMRGDGQGAKSEPVALTAREYNVRREYLLQKTPHVVFSDSFMELEAHLCRTFGGNLYAVDQWIAAAYPEDNIIKIKEVLCDEESFSQVVQSLIFITGSKAAIAVLPEGETPFMAAAPEYEVPDGIRWGFSLD